MTGVPGDHLGLPIPVDPAALRTAGTAWLTEAFRAAGSLPTDDRVTAVERCEEVAGGSTGRKAVLDVRYARARSSSELFVKFSRDLTDPLRDRGRTQLAAEVRFALLARSPAFPIPVARPVFADYHAASGTGILVTERIPFGRNGIEPHQPKCLDHLLDRPVEHYRALLLALARLAGTDRSGALGSHLADQFPVDLRAATVGEPPLLTPQRLERRLDRLDAFTQRYPGLLSPAVTATTFRSRLRVEAPRVLRAEPAIWRMLTASTDHVALCHWNANVDNAWFWRTDDGALHCGLLDWGCVSRMNVAMALWGALSGAEAWLWDRHLDELIESFCAEYHRAGGPLVDPGRLRGEVVVYTALMALTWLLDVPALVASRAESATDCTDPRIAGDESLRAPLRMLDNALNLWATSDLAAVLDDPPVTR